MAMEAETGVWLQAQDIGGRPLPAGTPPPRPRASGRSSTLAVALNFDGVLLVSTMRGHISTISRHPVCGFVPGTTNPVKERKAPWGQAAWGRGTS